MPLYGRTPSPPLSAFVSQLWLAHEYIVGPHRQERILPTGECSLIVDLRTSTTTAACGAPGATIACGPYSHSFVIDSADQFSVAGVQFKPWGARPIFGVPIREMTNADVPLDSLWGHFAAELRERMLEAPGPERKLAVLERMLLERLATVRPNHPAVMFAVREFRRDPAVVRIADVTGQIGLSHRRFLDLFTAEVGLTPKLFCRVRRFQQVLRQVYRNTDVDWASIALACGYYDQAHFIKDFVAFSGINPSTYRVCVGAHHNHVPVV